MSDQQTVPTYSLEESRALPGGEKEFFFDVRTQDMEINMGPQHPASCAPTASS
jgi:hypothetical protein